MTDETTFVTPEPLTLEIRLASADIAVALADVTESTVTIDGAEEDVRTINVTYDGDRLRIAAQRGRGPLAGLQPRRGQVGVRARIPAASAVDITTASGDARITGTLGHLAHRTASGDVRVEGQISGAADVRTVSGDAQFARVGGDLTITTVSGDVDVDSAGGSVAAKSVSGDITVRALRAGVVQVQTVSGDVELGICGGSCVDVDATSTSGRLSSEVPLSDGRADPQAGPAVEIRGTTVSGDFRLVRAA